MRIRQAEPPTVSTGQQCVEHNICLSFGLVVNVMMVCVCVCLFFITQVMFQRKSLCGIYIIY